MKNHGRVKVIGPLEKKLKPTRRGRERIIPASEQVGKTGVIVGGAGEKVVQVQLDDEVKQGKVRNFQAIDLQLIKG